jgi:hypothetical protein
VLLRHLARRAREGDGDAVAEALAAFERRALARLARAISPAAGPGGGGPASPGEADRLGALRDAFAAVLAEGPLPQAISATADAFLAKVAAAACARLGVAGGPPGGAAPARSDAAREDILRAARDRFTEEERRLYDLRALGRSWEEIGAEVGIAPEAARKRLGRAAKRVAQELAGE